MKTCEWMAMFSLLLGSYAVGSAEVSKEKPAGDAAEKAPEAAKAKPKKQPLAKGMTSEEVIANIGKPKEVRPMTTEAGEAEVWTYLRLVDKQSKKVASVVQEAAGGSMGMGMGGAENGIRTIYRTEHTSNFEITELLMLEGKLVMAKQRRETTRTLDP